MSRETEGYYRSLTVPALKRLKQQLDDDTESYKRDGERAAAIDRRKRSREIDKELLRRKAEAQRARKGKRL